MSMVEGSGERFPKDCHLTTLALPISWSNRDGIHPSDSSTTKGKTMSNTMSAGSYSNAQRLDDHCYMEGNVIVEFYSMSGSVFCSRFDRVTNGPAVIRFIPVANWGFYGFFA